MKIHEHSMSINLNEPNKHNAEQKQASTKEDILCKSIRIKFETGKPNLRYYNRNNGYPRRVGNTGRRQEPNYQVAGDILAPDLSEVKQVCPLWSLCVHFSVYML